MKRLLPILSVILISGLIYTCTSTPVDPGCCKNDFTVQGPGLSHHRFICSNILTLNNDGFNDTFLLFVIDTITHLVDTSMVMEFTVFNNLNNVLFHDTSYHNTFAGLDNNGNNIPDGNYKAEIEAPNGTIFSFTLTLIRVPIQDPICTNNCKYWDPGDPLLI